MANLPILRAIIAGLAYSLVIFGVGFAFGIMRILQLMPLFGDTLAVLVELPVILVVSWIICRWLIENWQVPESLAVRLIMGGVAFASLIVAEFGLASIAFARSPSQQLTFYTQFPALLGLAGQILFALFPAIQYLRDEQDYAE